MIFVEHFVKILKKNKVDFFTGVPDSILKNLSLYLENFSIKKHIIAANEGASMHQHHGGPLQPPVRVGR